MMETSKETKLWAAAAMAIILMVSSVIFVMTPSNATPFVMQIQNYRLLYGMGEKLDLTPVAQHHVKEGMKVREVVRFFEDSGFEIQRVRKRGKFEGTRYDTTVLARFDVNGILPAMTTDYHFTLYFRNQKLVKMVGKVYKEQAIKGTTIASKK